jgi:hypothetical protein
MNTTTARLLANIFAEAYDEAGSPPPVLKERQPSRGELDWKTPSCTLDNGQAMPTATSETVRASRPPGVPPGAQPPVPGQLTIVPQSSRGELGPTATRTPVKSPVKRHLSDRGRSLSLPNPVHYRPDSRPLNDYERYVYRVGGAEAFAAEVASTARQWQLIGRLSPNSLPTYPKTRQGS